MSMAELINLVTFLSILLCLCGSVYSLYLSKKEGNTSRSNKFDKNFAVLATIIYISAMVIIIKVK
jgi:hypothetical protein